jgi:hypothetical protein
MLRSSGGKASRRNGSCSWRRCERRRDREFPLCFESSMLDLVFAMVECRAIGGVHCACGNCEQVPLPIRTDSVEKTTAKNGTEFKDSVTSRKYEKWYDRQSSPI